LFWFFINLISTIMGIIPFSFFVFPLSSCIFHFVIRFGNNSIVIWFLCSYNHFW
jgi:hypothetical protein